jgi:predicted phage tail protein
MTSVPTDSSSHMFKMGKEQTDAMVNVQKELLDAYEQASRVWLARVQSEVDLWSNLANKLSATRSAPEALEAYREVVAQRMQMAADDGRRLFEECQNVTQKVTRSLSNGWPKAGS